MNTEREKQTIPTKGKRIGDITEEGEKKEKIKYKKKREKLNQTTNTA